MSIAEFKELVGMNIEQYESIPKDRDAFLKFYDAKDTKDLDRYYDSCSLYYNIFRKKYSFNIWWHKKGCQYPISCDSSQGEKGILTFDTPLEFTDHSDRLAGEVKFLYFHLMGEPFLHPHLAQFIGMARLKGFVPILTTNGTLLSQRTDLLDALPHKLQISLHSHEGNGKADLKQYIDEVMVFAMEAASTSTPI